MQRLEDAKLEAQRTSEIRSAVTALKTNLIFCLVNLVLFGLSNVVSPNVLAIMCIVFKVLLAVLTTVANFAKVRHMVQESWQNLPNCLFCKCFNEN
jgi:hypothetical protein